MTWIPCNLCHNFPCTCVPAYKPFPNTYQPIKVNLDAGYWHLSGLTDADVEKVAKKVVELLDARKPEPAPSKPTSDSIRYLVKLFQTEDGRKELLAMLSEITKGAKK